MSHLRRWLHEHVFTKLDDAHARRLVALALAVLFLGLTVGPLVLRAQQSTLPSITVYSLGGGLVTPVKVKATTVGDFQSVYFMIFRAGEATASLNIPGERSSAGGNEWEAGFTAGAPGAEYYYKARGISPVGQVDSLNTATFSMGGSSGSTGTVSACGNGTCESSLGENETSCSADCQAATPACSADTWGCSEWTACTSSGGQSRTCTMTFDCPSATTPPPEMSQTCTPPNSDTSGTGTSTCTSDEWSCGDWSACSTSGTQTRACSMTNDCPTATTTQPSTTQSCTPPTSGTAPTTCAADTWVCGDWSACASTGTQSRACAMSFDCPSATTAAPTSLQTCAVTNPTTVPVGPRVEIINPPSGSFFSGPVPLLARLHDGKAEKLVFRIRTSDDTTSDFLAIVGNYDSSTDRWRGYFETSKTGKFTVVAEAALPLGKTVQSELRVFSVSGVPAATAPTGTTTETTKPAPTSTTTTTPVAQPTTTTASFDVEYCVFNYCEPYNKRCFEIAGTDAAIRTACQTTSSACVKQCQEGKKYPLPPLPTPKPTATTTQVPTMTAAPTTIATCLRDKCEPYGRECTAKAGDNKEYLEKCSSLYKECASRCEKSATFDLPPIPEFPSASQPADQSTDEQPTDSAAPVTDRVKEFVVPPPAIAPAPSIEIARECVAAGVSGERCNEWLSVKYRSPECATAGILTREACEEHLRASDIDVDERALTGFASTEKLDVIRKEVQLIFNKSVAESEVTESIKSVIPVEVLPEESMTIIPPAPPARPTFESAIGIMVIDSDSDGLPDDVEKRLGTDPQNPDTDGDGFADGAEVKHGYDPLGAGKLVREVAPIEKAFANGAPLEEPRAAEEDKLDAAFAVATATTIDTTIEDSVEPSEATEPKEPAPIRLAGTATPNTIVTIYVYSFLPVVVTTTTDANGNWTYDFHSKLAEGRHEAYVSINDETGKIVKTSTPLSFFVKEAQAATEEDFLRGDVNVQAPAEILSRWFIFGGSILVLVALTLVAMIVRQIRKGSPIADGNSDGTPQL